MSEDEQSWTYGGVSDNIRRGRLLVWAMATVKPDTHWPYDDRAFARVVDELREINPIAKRIRTFPGSGGRHCPDFREMMTLMRSSGYVAHVIGSALIVLCVSPRGMKEMTRGFCEEETRAAVALMQTYWDQRGYG